MSDTADEQTKSAEAPTTTDPVESPAEETPAPEAVTPEAAQTYREGDEAAPEAKSAAKRVQTAFLVLRYEDGHVEAAVKVGVEMMKEASLRDIRDTCTSLAADVTTTMQANAAAQTMTRLMAQAQAAARDSALRAQILGGGAMGVPGLKR